MFLDSIFGKFSGKFFWKVILEKKILESFLEILSMIFFSILLKIELLEFFFLESSTGKFFRKVFFRKVFSGKFFSGKFFPESFFRKVFSGKFFPESFLRKVFSGKFFPESFFRKAQEKKTDFFKGIFWGIFRQYKSLDFF